MTTASPVYRRQRRCSSRRGMRSNLCEKPTRHPSWRSTCRPLSRVFMLLLALELARVWRHRHSGPLAMGRCLDGNGFLQEFKDQIVELHKAGGRSLTSVRSFSCRRPRWPTGSGRLTGLQGGP